MTAPTCPISGLPIPPARPSPISGFSVAATWPSSEPRCLHSYIPTCIPELPATLKDPELPAGMGFAHCVKTRVAVHSRAAVVGGL
jgi:hypothetical protein